MYISFYPFIFCACILRCILLRSILLFSSFILIYSSPSLLTSFLPLFILQYSYPSSLFIYPSILPHYPYILPSSPFILIYSYTSYLYTSILLSLLPLSLILLFSHPFILFPYVLLSFFTHIIPPFILQYSYPSSLDPCSDKDLCNFNKPPVTQDYVYHNQLCLKII